jgi:hypothetical protein
MAALKNNATTVETKPETRPVETIPANPNDPFGVHRQIIEEIEELGRRYAEPQK